MDEALPARVRLGRTEGLASGCRAARPAVPGSRRGRPGCAAETRAGLVSCSRERPLPHRAARRPPGRSPRLWPPARWLSELLARLGPPLGGFRFRFPSAVVEENESGEDSGPGRGRGRGRGRGSCRDYPGEGRRERPPPACSLGAAAATQAEVSAPLAAASRAPPCGPMGWPGGAPVAELGAGVAVAVGTGPLSVRARMAGRLQAPQSADSSASSGATWQARSQRQSCRFERAFRSSDPVILQFYLFIFFSPKARRRTRLGSHLLSKALSL